MDAGGGVAFWVESGAPGGDGELSWVDCYDSSSYAAFGWEAYSEGEFAGFIVEAAGLHDGVDTLGALWAEDGFSGGEEFS